MKAFLVLDELNQFHWAMLKSVLLILALLPIAEVSLKLWLSTEGSSQIMIGFFALSIVSAWLMVSFFTALKRVYGKLNRWLLNTNNCFLKLIVMCRWFLSSLVAYLSLQLSIAFNLILKPNF